MKLENNNDISNKEKNIDIDSDKNSKNNIIYKPKIELFPYYSKKRTYKKISKELDSQNLGKSCEINNKIFFQNNNEVYNIDSTQDNNNNIKNSSKIFKKKISKYLKKQNNINTPQTFKMSHLNSTRNSLNNKTCNNSKKDISPIKNYIEKNNYNFYINNVNKSHKNYNIIQQNNYINNSFEYNLLNNKNLSKNKDVSYNVSDNSKIYRTDRINRPYLNIFQKKMISISIQIIEKHFLKHKKNKILNQFFTNLKSSFLPDKYKKKSSKHNEYKDILYNYVKTNNFAIENKSNKLNNENKLINNKTVKNSEEEISKRNDKNSQRTKKSDIERLKELEKKYEKFYEKKKNSNIPINDKYRMYCLQKNKTKNLDCSKGYNISSTEDVLNDNCNNYSTSNSTSKSIIPIKQNIHKNKVITKKLIINRISNINNTKKYSTCKTEESPFKPYSIETSKNNNKIDNKIIIKKLKITPKLRKTISNEIKDNKNDILKNCNIHDIITRDKKLHIRINCLQWNYKLKNNKNRAYLYDNNSLKITNKNSFIICQKMKNKTNRNNYYLIKHLKNLTNTEEETDNKYNVKKSDNNNNN